MFVFLERETNYQFVHSAWHVAMAVAILFLLPKSPQDPSEDEKYTILDTRPPTTGYLPPPSHTESSFKHYPEGRLKCNSAHLDKPFVMYIYFLRLLISEK